MAVTLSTIMVDWRAQSGSRQEFGGTEGGGGVVAETRYVAGSGVALGSGDRWLLLTDPADETVTEELWTALASPQPDTRVLEIVERAFGGRVPGLAMVDLGAGAGKRLTRGHGKVQVQDATFTLCLEETSSGPARRFLGGVVNASSVEVRHVTAPGAPTAAVPETPLIDGIPTAILEAKGPDGPPPPRPRLRHRGPADSVSRDTSEPPVRFEPAAAAEPSAPSRPAAAPGPAVERAVDPETGSETSTETGTETGARPGDHDGSTVFRPEHLVAASSGESVQAVWCPEGHLTPPTQPLCRVCRSQVAPQHPQQVPRPVLGGLRLPAGEVVPLDRAVVLGRRPQPVATSGEWPHLVTVPAEHSFVSRLHLHLSLEGWQVIARDLGSRGGTTLRVPGQGPVRMVPDHPYQLEPGHALDLADTYEIRFVVGPDLDSAGTPPLGATR